MYFLERDSDVLLLCEELEKTIKKFKEESPWLQENDPPLKNRLSLFERCIASERHLIEDVSLPGRFVVEHFTAMMNVVNTSVGFKYRNVESGRGPLNQILVGDWGTIHLTVGDVTINWRDQNVQYMFYPDQLVVRPKDSLEDEITLFFSYSFKYLPSQLKKFQAVKDDPKTIYWHDGLNIEE
ncbi:MAG: hypothetical protein Q4C56_09730 [Peptococcaceae bacterium]|nr:hypothetical protein [Peptococcaceae bacterium]